MKKKSILERAKAIKVNARRNKPATQDEIELAFAWIADEITLTQMSKVLKYNPPFTLTRIAYALRDAYQLGLLRVK